MPSSALRRFPLLLVAMLALGLAAPPARGADAAAIAREQFQKGQKAMASGKPAEAVTAYQAAYDAGKAPSLLFYLGEANQKAGDTKKALEYYQLYLDKMPNAPKKAEAEAAIAELKKAPAKAAPKKAMALDAVELGAPAAAAATPKKKVAVDELSLDAPAKKAETQAAKAPEQAAAVAAAAVPVEKKPAPVKAAKPQEKPAVAAAPAAVPIEKQPEPPKPEKPVEKPAVAVAAAAAPIAQQPAPAKVEKPVEKAVVVAAAAAPPAEKPPAPPKAEKPVAAPAQAVGPAPSAPSAGDSARTMGLVLGGVSVAALAAGGIFAWQAKSATDENNEAAIGGKPIDPAKEEAGKRANSAAVLCFVGGGVGLLAGALMYGLAPSGPPEKSALRLEAAPLPGGALAGLSARW